MRNSHTKDFEEKAIGMARSLFHLPSAKQYPYHNLAHTQNVAGHAALLSAHYQLNHITKSNLLVAAWFHDTGHLFGPPEGHEAKSISLMEEALSRLETPYNAINDIAGYIHVTQKEIKPPGVEQQIMCDADTWHFGTEEFKRTDLLVKEEMEIRYNKKIFNWREKSIQLLEAHEFYTSYCKEHLAAGKSANMQWLTDQS